MIDAERLKGKMQEIFDDFFIEIIINEFEDLIVNEVVHNFSIHCVENENINEFTKHTDSWFDYIMRAKEVMNLDKD